MTKLRLPRLRPLILDALNPFHRWLVRFLFAHMKKVEVVEKIEIEYLELPRWLCWGGSRSRGWISEGTCFSYSRSESFIILLSSNLCQSSEFRYTLYHEYWEGVARFNHQAPAHISREQVEAKLLMGAFIWRVWAPGIEQALEEVVKLGQSENHIKCLILELELAYREMSPSEFHAFLLDIMKNRM